MTPRWLLYLSGKGASLAEKETKNKCVTKTASCNVPTNLVNIYCIKQIQDCNYNPETAFFINMRRNKKHGSG